MLASSKESFLVISKYLPQSLLMYSFSRNVVICRIHKYLNSSPKVSAVAKIFSHSNQRCPAINLKSKYLVYLYSVFQIPVLMVFILEDAILSSFLGFSSISRLLPFVVPQSWVLNISVECCMLHLTCRRQSSQWTNFLHQQNTEPVVGASAWHGGSSMLKERAQRNILFTPGSS